MPPFSQRLTTRIQKIDSLLCVGLDPHPEDMAEPAGSAAEAFCRDLIDATRDIALAYKPNSAFFEALGPEGLEALQNVTDSIPEEIPVILDVKRGDISSTARAYAQAAYDTFGADAVTINPYLGRDAVQPFASRAEKGVFLLCKTSNPGSKDLQDLPVVTNQGAVSVFEHLAHLAKTWNQHDNIGLVVGATHPDALQRVRRAAPDLWILAPGIGAQGGDLPGALKAGLREDGLGMIVPVSRGISRAESPRQAAFQLREKINQVRSEVALNRQRPQPVLSPLKRQIADALLEVGCLKFGRFTLKSGLESPFYIDLRRLVRYPQVLVLISEAYHMLLDTLMFDHLAPLPYAALPIGTAVSLRGGWSMIYPRKEAKSYGTKAAVEGVFQAGDRAVVLDDLITTGGSKLEGIRKLAQHDLQVQDVVVLIDRSRNADQELAAAGINLHAVLHLKDMLAYYQETEQVSRDHIRAVQTFLKAD